MQLSVVILNYNVRFFLEVCVQSVQAALKNIESEIIVVDNNSSDDSVEIIKKNYPNVHLIACNENYGFPKGNNIGVDKAKGEYICILNPDTIVAEDTFEILLDAASKINDLGAVGCRLIDGGGRFLPESKRGIPTPWVAFTKVAGLYKFFPKSSLFNRYYFGSIGENEASEVEILVGAFMLMRKKVYQEVGGFDERCFMYSDDIDLSYTLLKTKRKNYYSPSTTVVHFKGESTVKDAKYMLRFREAMEFFYQKHFKKSYIFSLLMKIGSWWFSYVKAQNKGDVRLPVEQYYVCTDSTILHEIVVNKVGKEVKLISLDDLQKMNFTCSEIIFDPNYVTYRTILQCMQQKKNRGVYFKILSCDHRFYLGSHDSNDRGEIVKLV